MCSITRHQVICHDTVAFTLLECLLALGLLSLLLAGALSFTFPSMRAAWRSREAAASALGILRKARWLAISEDREYGVVFSRPDPGQPWQAQILRKASLWYPCEPPRPLPPAVASIRIAGPALKEFNPDGTSCGGSVTIVCDNGRAYRITLTPATGSLRLYRERA